MTISTVIPVYPSICLCISVHVSEKLAPILRSCHKMSLIKFSWCVLRGKNMHSGSHSDPLGSWVKAKPRSVQYNIMLRPWIWMTSTDDTSLSMDDIHGWHFHPWMRFLHPWMEFLSVRIYGKIVCIILSNIDIFKWCVQFS